MGGKETIRVSDEMYRPMTDYERESITQINGALRELLRCRLLAPGNLATLIEGLQLIRRDGEECGERCFERPLAALVVQGSKHSVFGDREYAYGENQCLVAGVDMPSQFNAVAATPEKPFLSLCLYLDQRTVSELCVEMAREGVPDSVECCGVAVADAGADLLGCMLRLVELLDKPEQIPFRAPLILRELHYLLLTGPTGGVLRKLNTLGTHNNQVVQAISWLKKNLEKPFRVEELARRVHMSTSSLHRHFKAVTGFSPLQYHKQLRLYEAQRLMLTENERAASAALAVGYESVTQFSREYKRFFGDSLRRDTMRRRERTLEKTDIL